MAIAQQPPLLLEQTAVLKAPRRMDLMYGFLRGVQDDGLDVVGAGASANGCEAEFEDLDAQSDACFARARAHIRRGEYALADVEIEHGLFIDNLERKPVGKGFCAVRVMRASGRQIVNKIERLLSPSRQRAGKGQVTR
jgi:hypothetical protein